MPGVPTNCSRTIQQLTCVLRMDTERAVRCEQSSVEPEKTVDLLLLMAQFFIFNIRFWLQTFLNLFSPAFLFKLPGVVRALSDMPKFGKLKIPDHILIAFLHSPACLLKSPFKCGFSSACLFLLLLKFPSS